MCNLCPQSDSNRHCADFKSAASANWAMGACTKQRRDSGLKSTASVYKTELEKGNLGYLRRDLCVNICDDTGDQPVEDILFTDVERAC